MAESKKSFGSRTRRLWREGTNPLYGLSPRRVTEMMSGITEGRMASMMWTLAAPNSGIEAVDATLHALIERRLSALDDIEWKVLSISPETRGFDQVLAQEQEAALREAYESLDDVYAVVSALGMATFRGVGLLYIERAADRSIRGLHQVDPWNLARRGMRGSWVLNQDAQDVSGLQISDEWLLPDEDILVRTCDRSIAPIALYCYIRHALTDRDWDKFLELFGIANGVVTAPPNASQEDIDALAGTAEELSQGAAAAIPNGATWTPNDKGASIPPFEARCEYLQKLLVLAGTGGMLTMLNDATGMGSGQSDAHSATFAALARREARQISGLMQRRIDADILGRLFPGRPRLAYWDLAPADGVEVGTIVDHATKLASAGVRIKTSALSELTGYDLEEAPATSAQAGLLSPVLNRRPGTLDAEYLKPIPEDLQAAGDAWDKQLADELAKLPEDPEQFRAALEALAKRLPEMLGDDQEAKLLAEEMMRACAAGAAAQFQKKAKTK